MIVGFMYCFLLFHYSFFVDFIVVGTRMACVELVVSTPSKFVFILCVIVNGLFLKPMNNKSVCTIYGSLQRLVTVY